MKSKSFILLLVFVLVINVLAAQSNYEYLIIGNGGVKNTKWVRSEHAVSKGEEKNMDKLEVQKIEFDSFEQPVVDGLKSMQSKGWEVFHVKENLLYLRRPKK